jgi:hypothetical protein
MLRISRPMTPTDHDPPPPRQWGLPAPSGAVRDAPASDCDRFALIDQRPCNGRSALEMGRVDACPAVIGESHRRRKVLSCKGLFVHPTAPT